MNEYLVHLASEASSESPDTFLVGREVEPQRCACADSCNDIHEAIALGVEELIVAKSQEFDERFEIFKSDEALKHDNPGYIINGVAAGGAYAKRQYAQSVELDLAAYEAACNPPPASPAPPQLVARRKAISASNLCSGYRALAMATDNPEERQACLEMAIEWGEKALTHDRRDATSVVELAMAVDDIGDAETADRLLSVILPLVDFRNERNALAQRLRYERPLLCREHLSSVRALLAMMD